MNTLELADGVYAFKSELVPNLYWTTHEVVQAAPPRADRNGSVVGTEELFRQVGQHIRGVFLFSLPVDVAITFHTIGYWNLIYVLSGILEVDAWDEGREAKKVVAGMGAFMGGSTMKVTIECAVPVKYLWVSSSGDMGMTVYPS